MKLRAEARAAYSSSGHEARLQERVSQESQSSTICPEVVVYDWLLIQAIVFNCRTFEPPIAAVNLQTSHFHASCNVHTHQNFLCFKSILM